MWITEHWNHWAQKRQDLFGFIDLLALRGDETLAVQVTSADHVAERVKKIADHDNIGAVRKANWKVVVHGWGKRADGTWHCREVDCS